jgi:hypothetical protein
MSVDRKPTGQQQRAVMSITNHCFVLDAGQPDPVASFSHTTWHPAVSDKAAPYVAFRASRAAPMADTYGVATRLPARSGVAQPVDLPWARKAYVCVSGGGPGVCPMASSGVLPLAWSVSLMLLAACQGRGTLTSAAPAVAIWVHPCCWTHWGSFRTTSQKSASLVVIVELEPGLDTRSCQPNGSGHDARRGLPIPSGRQAVARKKPVAKRDKLAQYLWPTPRRPGREPAP